MSMKTKRNRLILAAKTMDWQQVVQNGGPPCFHLEKDGRFCGRAKLWQGHGVQDFHDFVSLDELLSKFPPA